MLISKTFINNFGNDKKKNTFSKNVFNKSILVILLAFLVSLYLISKSNDLMNWSRFDFFNKLFISNGFIIKNIQIKILS